MNRKSGFALGSVGPIVQPQQISSSEADMRAMKVIGQECCRDESFAIANRDDTGWLLGSYLLRCGRRACDAGGIHCLCLLEEDSPHSKCIMVIISCTP